MAFGTGITQEIVASFMATAAINLVGAGANFEIGRVVSALPLVLGVAGFAVHGSLQVHDSSRLCKVLDMAVKATLRLLRKLKANLVGMALYAVDGFVCAPQWKSGHIVHEFGRMPGLGIVTLTAGWIESALMQVDVTGVARWSCRGEICYLMAIEAVLSCVLTRKRESGFLVLKADFLPAGGCVARATGQVHFLVRRLGLRLA